MYWIPNWPIFSRTCLTSSARPAALTWASKSVMDVPLERFVVGTVFPGDSRPGRLPSLSYSQLTTAMRSSAEHERSAPRKRAVGGRMQSTLGEAREAKRPQQLARPAADVLGHELADTDHLVAVVRIGDYVDVIAETVEDWKIIGGEGT